MSARPPVWRRLRWRRWMAPWGAVFVLCTFTVVTWAVDHETATDRDFLEPGSTAAVGSHRLAGQLDRRGVTVQRYGGSAGAVEGARAGGTTVLVTAPDFVRPDALGALLSLPADDRVVLVDPSPGVLAAQDLPVRRTGSRWTTGVRPAGCGLPGPAATLGSAYAVRGGTRCFDGGLVRVVPAGGPEIVVVGAADVFRNDRLGEHRNAALAGALLGGYDRVAWLSLHRPERATAPAVPPTTEPTPRPTEPLPTDTPSGQPTDLPTPSGTADGGGSGRQAGGDRSSPLGGAFPPWVWAVVAQVLLAAVLFALWRARRLGTPVAEPLPVVVPAAETVRGRARLYQRAKARGVALGALRAGALRRLAPVLADLADGQPAGGDRPATVVSGLARRAGWPPDRVHAVLFGPEPETDDELRAAVAELDELVRRVQEEGRGAGHD